MPEISLDDEDESKFNKSSAVAKKVVRFKEQQEPNESAERKIEDQEQQLEEEEGVTESEKLRRLQEMHDQIVIDQLT